MFHWRFIFACLVLFAADISLAADLRVGTVTRAPFSMLQDGQDTGFSMDLWKATASRIGMDYTVQRFDSFSQMLEAVKTDQVDLAIANISITSEREQIMDFSQPIFSSGLQIMTPVQEGGISDIWHIFTSAELMLPLLFAFAMLFGGGMLMWWFEHGRQDYFNKPARQSTFPAFWWALNLVVNGGFEERVPRSFAGRIFGVILVISSLFLVSVFVASITSRMTVDAIKSSVTSVNDLYGSRVATVSGSTAASFLQRRVIVFKGYDNPQDMFAAFESGEQDAIVFDAPILAYYVTTHADQDAQLAGPVFLRENYGIALPTGSALAEDINQTLLNIREDGTYQELIHKWFGMIGE